MTKKQELEKIRNKAIACEKCALCAGRKNVVFGDGNIDAEIIFVGEAPGKNEDEQGKPFVGSAGKILASLLEKINLKRENVYITNVIKCRPPLNRDPLFEEKDCCSDYLQKEIAVIKPRIIVLLGRHAMDYFLPGLKIFLDHGKLKRKDGQNYFPIYHPAATIYNRALKEVLEKDFRKIPKIIEKISKTEEANI